MEPNNAWVGVITRRSRVGRRRRLRGVASFLAILSDRHDPWLCGYLEDILYAFTDQGANHRVAPPAHCAGGGWPSSQLLKGAALRRADGAGGRGPCTRSEKLPAQNGRAERAAAAVCSSGRAGQNQAGRPIGRGYSLASAAAARRWRRSGDAARRHGSGLVALGTFT